MSTPRRTAETDPSPRLTLCLAMDLNGSTASGLRLSTKKLDRFNLALVNQLRPHLTSMQLEGAVVKFTGDGWLVMSDDQEHAASLCCLAVIMACQFQLEVARDAGLSLAHVPTMRLAICWGRDLPVMLPDGQRDFVGNSVRRAVRASQLCRENEILIDETVRTWIAHDFRTNPINLTERLDQRPFAKMEEELVLHVLEELRVESAMDSDAPLCFVNALATIGRVQEADDLADRISDQLMRDSTTHQESGTVLLSRWNDLLAANLDYETAREVLSRLVKAGLQPDVNTFNALIDKSQDYRSQSRWLQTMIQDGIRPNTLTFNILLRNAKDPNQVARRVSKMNAEGVLPDIETMSILVAQSPDFSTASRWVERVETAGIAPSVGVLEALIEKAPDFATAKQLVDRIFSTGAQPTEAAFISLFSNDLSGVSADDLLKWYLGLRYHPTHPVKRAIAEYRRKGLIDDALRLALDYPHTDTALRLIRQHSDRALDYFNSVVEHDPRHPNGAYAMGLALVEVGRTADAEPWLRKAYELAAPGPRKDELARYLSLFERIAVPVV